MAGSPPADDGAQKGFAIRAPSRIDFGGGWTDVPPYDTEQGGFVCNVAISRYATVRVNPMYSAVSAEMEVTRPSDAGLLRAVTKRYPVRGARMSLTSNFPVGAGLGGSSAAGVALCAAAFRWRNETQSLTSIAEASRDIEVSELGIAGGRQDHYAAALGGALGIRFGESVSPEPISLSPETIAELPKRCIVMYTGESRISATTITAVLDAYRNGDAGVRASLARMRLLAQQMPAALSKGDFDTLGALVGEHWHYQRTLHPGIPTPAIDHMIAKATAAGAIGCKALGASGGGCVVAIATADRAAEVRKAITGLGKAIEYTVDQVGVTQCE